MRRHSSSAAERIRRVYRAIEKRSPLAAALSRRAYRAVLRGYACIASVWHLLRIRLHTRDRPGGARIVGKIIPPLPAIYCGERPDLAPPPPSHPRYVDEALVCHRSDAYVALRHAADEGSVDAGGDTPEFRFFFSAYHNPERLGFANLASHAFYRVFEDYINASGIISQTILYDYEAPLRRAYPFDASAPVVYIFYRKLPAFIRRMVRRNDDFRKRVCMLNMEQLNLRHHRKYLADARRLGVRMLDYSAVNMKWLPRSAHHLPYRCNRAETERLKRFSAGPLEYDVAVIGTSRHRWELISQLERRGITVVHIRDAWRDERDAAVGKAGILLNIHISDEHTIYEHARCDRWMFAGKPIISEESERQAALDVGGNVVFAPRGELLHSVEQALAGLDDFRHEFTHNDLEAIAASRDARWREFAATCAGDLAI